MNPFFHPEFPAVRHQELLAERASDRQVAAGRRLLRTRRSVVRSTAG